MAAAGVDFQVIPADVDEPRIVADLQKDRQLPSQIASTLAFEKARMVSDVNAGVLVLGADQVLVCDHRLYQKPKTLVDAKNDLLSLRGREHILMSAVSLVRDGVQVWSMVSKAHLTMRDFSDAFLDDYVSTQGADLLTTVGCYKLEGAGSALFSKVDGDYFTILGLPLLDVLACLRNFGELPS